MESIKILFGKRVKELRKQHSYTQERLAELVGIDTRNLIKIENGQTFPREMCIRDRYYAIVGVCWCWFFE